MEVRRATELDADWILSELKAFSQFYGTKKSIFGDEEYARAGLSTLIENHLFLIADQDGERLGLIAGYNTPHPFNPQIQILSEAFWWVPEKHRQTGAGSCLLDEFLKYGEAHADWIGFTLEHHSPVDERVLTRRGFSLRERQYLKEVE